MSNDNNPTISNPAHVRQAIVTKYLGPTDHRGSRVKATAAAGSVIVPWDHALDSYENHTRAALALAREFGWGGVWVGGGLPNEAGYCFTCQAD